MAALTPQKLSIRKPLAGTPAPKFSDDLRVAWVPGAKPAGSISGDRYAQYSVAKTVGEAKKLGAKQADVKWDWDKGYMQLTDQQGVPLGGFAPPPAQEVAVSRPQKRERVEKVPQMTTPQKRAASKPEKAEKTPAVARPQPEVTRKEVVEPPPPAKRVRTLALPRILARALKLRSLGLLPPLAAAAPAVEAPEEAPERTAEQQVEVAPMQVEEKTEEQLEVQQADGDAGAAQVDQEEEQQGEEPAAMEEPAEAAPEEPMQVDEQNEEPQEVQQADEETPAAQVDQEEEEQKGEEPASMEEPASEEQQHEAEPTTEL